MKKINLILLIIAFSGLAVFIFWFEVNDNKKIIEENNNQIINEINNQSAGEIENKNEINNITLEPLTSEEINEIIEVGVNWLKQSQEPNGHFRYEYSPLADSYSKQDLMVRQTGALYVLGEILKKDKENKYELKDTIIKAIDYFEENSKSGEMNDYEFRCVLRNTHMCSLGGTSLTLIGILDLVEVYPELKNEYNGLITDYLNHLLAMKKPKQGFRGFYYLNGSPSETESHFSNGEAFLALVKYYKYNPTDEVKIVIDDSFDYFETKYGEVHDYNFYLWGMGAIKDLSSVEPTDKYHNFVKAYTDWRISAYKNRRATLGNKCAYIEGVISAYSVIEPNLTEEEKEYYLEEINFWLTKSRGLQANSSGFLNLKYGNKTYDLKVLKPEKAQGGFLTALNNPYQRIDFTQHCISSYLQKLTDIDNKSL